MFIISNPIKKEELEKVASKSFQGMIKFVVDLEKEIIALDAELHADLEQLLLESGSVQENLWGGNYYFSKTGDHQIEYSSLINIRPAQGNRGMTIEDVGIKNKIKQIINKLIV
jgi:hypothetical protein